jgi:Tfp pilus assembly protein PilO
MEPSNTDKRLQTLRFIVHGSAAAGLATLLLVAWWTLIRPLETQQYVASQRLNQLAAKLAAAEDVRSENASLQGQFTAALEREASLQARVPDDPAEAEFLALASDLAARTGVQIKDYRPGKSAAGPSCSSLEVQLIGEGDYEGLCRFLDGIAKLPRHSAIAGLHIDAKGGKEAYLVEISVLLYFAATTEPMQGEREVPHA